MKNRLVDKSTLKIIYACTKLALVSTNVEKYSDPGYYSVACDQINTGEEKHFFLSETAAQALLKKNGTFWCVYEMNIPVNQFTVNPKDGQIVIDKRHRFKAEDITAIHFHSTFMPGITAQNYRV